MTISIKPTASGSTIEQDGSTILTVDGSGNITPTNNLTATSLTTSSGSAPSYSARAWVNFNGTGTVAIRASGNVSSITDDGTGIYTVNFTTAMPDVNYSVTSSKQNTAADNDVSIQDVISVRTTSSCKVYCKENITNTDSNNVNIAVFR